MPPITRSETNSIPVPCIGQNIGCSHRMAEAAPAEDLSHLDPPAPDGPALVSLSPGLVFLFFFFLLGSVSSSESSSS